MTACPAGSAIAHAPVQSRVFAGVQAFDVSFVSTATLQDSACPGHTHPWEADACERSVVEQPGGLGKLNLTQVPEPLPGPGAIQIRIAFAGCNWSDIQKRQGVYPDPVDYPVILGAEVSGIVSGGGGAVSGTVASAIGSRRSSGLPSRADFAEFLRDRLPLCHAASLRHVVEAGSGIFPVVALTAYHLLHSAHRLRRGETVLIHAIGGAVGLMLTQMAVRKGAKVIGTVGNAGQGPRCRSPMALTSSSTRTGTTSSRRRSSSRTDGASIS